MRVCCLVFNFRLVLLSFRDFVFSAGICEQSCAVFCFVARCGGARVRGVCVCACLAKDAPLRLTLSEIIDII